MTMIDRSRIKAEAKIVAKVEASAKASFQRKKIIVEAIPPDVSRAKAGAWLTLISPITEWAGLKGDALRFRREQLRIQQDETLMRIARSVSEKIGNQAVLHPVPSKIFIPLLEKASLEDPSDQMMVDIWSNLLVSATSKGSVPPRFVHIVGELNSRQANLFLEVATKRLRPDHQDKDMLSLVFELQPRRLTDRIDQLFKRRRLSVDDVYVELMDDLEGPCVALTDLWVNGGQWFVPTDKNKFGEYEAQADLQILASLGLLREFRIYRSRNSSGVKDVEVLYFVLTELGVDFYLAVAGKA